MKWVPLEKQINKNDSTLFGRRKPSRWPKMKSSGIQVIWSSLIYLVSFK